MNEFDLKAQEWDSNLSHNERAHAVAEKIISVIPLDNSMDALEYGAGTGLLSMNLNKRLHSVVLMDSSVGMVRAMELKISNVGLSNMRAVLWDLEKREYEGIFDFTYSLMVLHHVGDTELIFRRFNSLLTKEGYLAVADLYSEDGSFHGEGFTGHKGFDPHELEEKLRMTGFRNIRHEQCFILTKTLGNGETKDFPLFLLTAIKQD